MFEIPIKYKQKFAINATIDDEYSDELSQYKWHLLKAPNTFYITTNKKINGTFHTLKMHRMIMEIKLSRHIYSCEYIDHVDGNGWNNCISNLRLCSSSDNIANSKVCKRSSSGYKGVSWHKRDCKWQAYLTHKRTVYHLGYFTSKNDAAIAYNTKAKELFCEYAHLNDISNDREVKK